MTHSQGEDRMKATEEKLPPEERCHFCCGCFASMCLHSRKACAFCVWCDGACQEHEGELSHAECRVCLRDFIVDYLARSLSSRGPEQA